MLRLLKNIKNGSLTEQHKAALITALIGATVVLSVFNFHLKQQATLVVESYYEMTPPQVSEKQALSKKPNRPAETNQAFDQNKEANRFHQAYKPIPEPEYFELPEMNTSITASRKHAKTKETKIEKTDLEAFNAVNNLLKKHKKEANNARSTVEFSLINRKKRHIPIPVYLCEQGGEVIVSIVVNAAGSVTQASINGASEASDGCLKTQALKYAQEAVFSPQADKPSQLGTITFRFVEKQ